MPTAEKSCTTTGLITDNSPSPEEHGKVPALLLSGVPEGLRLGPPLLLLRRLGEVRVEEAGAQLVVPGGLGRVVERVRDDPVRAGVEAGVDGLKGDVGSNGTVTRGSRFRR